MTANAKPGGPFASDALAAGAIVNIGVAVLLFGVERLSERADFARRVRRVTRTLQERKVTLDPSESRRLVRILQNGTLIDLIRREGINDVALNQFFTRHVLGHSEGDVDAHEARAHELESALTAAVEAALDADDRVAILDAIEAHHRKRNSRRTHVAESDTSEGLLHEIIRLVSPAGRVPLEPAWRRPPAGAQLSLQQLLWARNGIVPYLDSAGALSNLAGWCQSGDPLGVRVVAGPGGDGKTRLGLELCRAMRDRGWVAGFYRPSLGSTAPLAGLGAPRLIVVDYADLVVEEARGLFDSLCLASRPLRRFPVRLLLLVRTRRETWDALRPFTKKQDRFSIEVERGGVLGTRINDAAPLPIGDRRKLFDSASDAFGRVLSSEHPRWSSTRVELSHPVFATR